MPNEWTIHDHKLRGGQDKSELLGCHIIKNDEGTAYQFTEPNPQNVLSTTTGNSLPTPPFAFPTFSFGDPEYDWDITVTTLTAGKHGNEAKGNWSNDDPSPDDDESGTWTAQAGAGMDGEEDAAAASA
jgi:hypothetical protein